MLDVGGGHVRVFHRLGDYKHKQRNRMKFLIKRAGLGRAGAAKFESALAEVQAEGGAPLPFDPDDAAGRDGAGLGAAGGAVARRRARHARGDAQVAGPGILPGCGRSCTLPTAAFARWLRTQRARRRSRPATRS